MVVGGSAHINEAYIMPMHTIIDDIKHITGKKEVAVAYTAEKIWQSGGESGVRLHARQSVLLPSGNALPPRPSERPALAPVHPDSPTLKSSYGFSQEKASMARGVLAATADNESQASQHTPSRFQAGREPFFATATSARHLDEPSSDSYTWGTKSGGQNHSRLQAGSETSIGTATGAPYLDKPSSKSYTRRSATSVSHLGLPTDMSWSMANYLNDRNDIRLARMFGLEPSIHRRQSLSGVLPYDDASRLSMDISMLPREGSRATTCTSIGIQALSPALSSCNSFSALWESKKLECPFSTILNCLSTYSNEEEWIRHSLTHFDSHGRAVEPPRSNSCRFCDENFYSLTPTESWVEMMRHTSLHYAVGYDISHARPDYALLKYLFDHRIISDAEYRHLKNSLVTLPPPPVPILKECSSINKGRRGRQRRQESSYRRPDLAQKHRPIVHNDILSHAQHQIPRELR